MTPDPRDGSMAGWKPIDTAPKDGTLILLGRAESDEEVALSLPGTWDEGYPDGPDDMGHDGGFSDVNYNDFFPGRSFGNPAYQRPGSQPTHWQPLPSPPKVE